MKRITAVILAVLFLISCFAVNAEGIDLTKYGVFQTALIKRMGGDVKGFGMLAKYDSSPESIYIKREAASYSSPFYECAEHGI
ncbi:MAG: hypothetical protein IJC74_09400 [Clostridia bacterium]|nr:hypothetical protein [Clostridia bacterium]